MSNSKQNTWNRLSALWADQGVRTLDIVNKKYVLVSDTHLGDGGESDDFFKNRLALLRALEHYQRKGYFLILLGDIEEFWQFDLERISACYDQTIYAKIRLFGDEHVLRIFGNHDHEWAGLKDPARQVSPTSALAEEAVKLRDSSGAARVLVIHGHQGSVDADKYSWFSRFFVRLFRGIEPLVKLTGLYGHSSATKSSIAKDYERTFYQWAEKNQVIVICGHSHRAIFAARSYAQRLVDDIARLRAEISVSRTSKQKREQNLKLIDQKERQLEDEKDKGRLIDPLDPEGTPLPCYFNTGCGLYSDGITALEIDNGVMRLVKWSRDAFETPFLEVYDRGKLDDFLAQMAA